MTIVLNEAKRKLEEIGFLDIQIPKIGIYEEIQRLRKEKNVVLLAHYYQETAIQDLADYVGDSLGLAQKAANTNADIILFAGVHFMAETAKILNPDKKVILPDLKAGCSLAESCSAEDLMKFKTQYPNHIVITYINASAAVKAYSDLVCTSSNAEKIINSIPKDQSIIFAPDKNLGKYLNKITGRNMILWEGACIVHEAFSIEKLIKLHKQYPESEIIAHPESEEHILEIAKYIGSTSGIINYVKQSTCKSFIIATEAGILHKMKAEVPNKKLIPAPAKADNTCACSECHYMKMNTIEKIYLCLKYELPEIIVPKNLQIKALTPIKRMLELSK